MTRRIDFKQIDRNQNSSPQGFDRVEYQPYHHVIRWAPILLAWTIFATIYNGQENILGRMTAIQYINYLVVIVIWLLAFIPIFIWSKETRRKNSTAILALSAAIFMYMFGLVVAIHPPPLSLLRREFVTISTGASFIIILLTMPSTLYKLRLRVQWVLLMISIARTAFSILAYWQSWGTTARLGREQGIFDQGSISGMFAAIGVWVLLFRGRVFNLSKPVLLSLAALISSSALLTASFLSLTLIGLAWCSYFLSAVRNFLIRGMLFSFLLAAVLIYISIPPPSALDLSKTINSRSTALINWIITKDFTYVYNNSTFALRLALTKNAAAKMPEHIFRGNGLSGNFVLVNRVSLGGRQFSETIPVHNALLTLWLESGGLAVIPYLIFIFAIARMIWGLEENLMAKSWKFASIAGIFLITFSVTNPFDITLIPYLIMIICFTSSPSGS